MLERLKEFLVRAVRRVLTVLAVTVGTVLVALIAWWALSKAGVIPSISELRAEVEGLVGDVSWKQIAGFVLLVPLVGVVAMDLLDEWLGTGRYGHQGDYRHRDDRDDRFR